MGGARWSWETDLRSGVQDRLGVPSVLSPPLAAYSHRRANSTSIPSPLPTFYSMPLPSAQGTSLASPLSLLSQSSWSTDASTVLDSWPGACVGRVRHSRQSQGGRYKLAVSQSYHKREAWAGGRGELPVPKGVQARMEG